MSVVVIIIVVLVIVFVKSLIRPLFFIPKLTQYEALQFLESQDCVFVDFRSMVKKEKQQMLFNNEKPSFFESMFSETSKYVVVGFSEDQDSYKMFWIKLTQWFLYHPKGLYESLIGKRIEKERQIEFVEELDPNNLKTLERKYSSKTVIVKDSCPACKSVLTPNERVCPGCGLVLC